MIDETDFACRLTFPLDAMPAADHAHGFKTHQGRGGGFHRLEAACRTDYAFERVEWHRWLTPHQRRATSWFNNTKWKVGRVTIGADDDPVNTMNSPEKSRT